MSRAIVLSVHDLGVAYGSREVVSHFSLMLHAGETVALMGPSGSGKTSILACTVGLQVPTSGTVTVADQEMTGSTGHRARLRREFIGVAYQSPGLLPELTVEENVAVTLLFDGVSRREALDAARESLATVDLDEHGGKRIDELSGGEAQRVSLARALVRPAVSLLVADEPTANLDEDNAIAVARLIVERAKDLGVGVVLATHDTRVAAECDRVLNLRGSAAV